MTHSISLMISLVVAACVQPSPDIYVKIYGEPDLSSAPDRQRQAFQPNPSPSTPPEILISPANLDFGAVKAGQQANTRFMVSNTGGKPLTIDQAIFQGADAFYFIHENGPQAEDDEAPFIAWVPPLTLMPGEAASLTVNFHPLQTIGMAGRLILRTNDTDPEVQVTGTGVSYCPPLSHAELNFGTVPSGAQVRRTVHVAGCATGLRVLAIAASADSDSEFVIDTSPMGDNNQGAWMIDPHETTGFNVHFRPDENAVEATEFKATAMVATVNSNEVIELPVRGSVTHKF